MEPYHNIVCEETEAEKDKAEIVKQLDLLFLLD